MNVLLFVSLFLAVIGSILIVISLFLKDKYKFTLKTRNKDNYAILIPARDESKVIRNLLESINRQVKDMDSVYVIVESLEDLTCDITKEYGANIIIRKDLTKQRKGYALDEALKEIMCKNYDLFFIFDADNILQDGFIDEMLKTYKKGYDIGVGYRNIKNSNNLISLCSGITFTAVNILNKIKNFRKEVVTISGTGLYISSEVINELNGYPFFSLTEDYELSLYAKLNNISTFYNESAIFYDEQPTNLKTSITQRTRWIKGFLEARNKQLKNNKIFKYNLGIIPYLLIILSILMFIFTNVCILFLKFNIDNLLNTLKYISLVIISVYIVLFILTTIVILLDKKLNIKEKDKIKVIFMNPIFLFTYLICFVKAVTNKNLKWEKIEHHENIIKIDK